MKLCFSTLGCPNWSLGEIISAAKDLNYQGIELRGAGEDLLIPDARMFSPENIERTSRGLAKAGVEIACLSSDCRLNREDGDSVGMAKRYVALARQLGAKYVRVMGDDWVEPGDGVNDRTVLTRLMELAPGAEAAGVTLLLESNGVFARSERLRDLLKSVDSPFVRALWDVNHPVRNYGESAEETWDHIGPYVRHVHLKDSAVENGRVRYKMLGYGTLPLKGVMKALKHGGYGGYLSLEWVKRWNEELEDAGIVFSHFAWMARKMWEEA